MRTICKSANESEFRMLQDVKNNLTPYVILSFARWVRCIPAQPSPVFHIMAYCEIYLSTWWTIISLLALTQSSANLKCCGLNIFFLFASNMCQNLKAFLNSARIILDHPCIGKGVHYVYGRWRDPSNYFIYLRIFTIPL